MGRTNYGQVTGQSSSGGGHGYKSEGDRITAEVTLNSPMRDDMLEGIVHNSQHPNSEPYCQVYVPALHGELTDDEKNNLPWSLNSIGEGAGKGEGTTSVIPPGTRVKVKQETASGSVLKVVKKLPMHEKPNKCTQTPVPLTQPDTLDKKNPADFYINNDWLEKGISGLSTALVNKMQGTIFSIFNSSLIDFVSLGTGSLTREMNMFGNIEQDIVDVITGNFGFPYGFLPPEVKVAGGLFGDVLDLTKDFSRAVDNTGGSIGNIGSMISIDGWPADFSQWEVIPDINSNIQIDQSGKITLKPGLPAGQHSNNFRIRNNAIDWDYIDGLPQLAKDAIYAFLPEHVQDFSMIVQAVNDLSLLNFEDSINFLETLPEAEIGARFASSLIPKIEYKTNKKGTDKAVFGQLHVIGADDGVSLEIDLTKGIPAWVSSTVGSHI